MMFFIDNRLFSPQPPFLAPFVASRYAISQEKEKIAFPTVTYEETDAPQDIAGNQTERDHDDRLDGLGDHAAILQFSQRGSLLLCERPSRSGENASVAKAADGIRGNHRNLLTAANPGCLPSPASPPAQGFGGVRGVCCGSARSCDFDAHVGMNGKSLPCLCGLICR